MAENNNTGAWIGFAGTILAALIGAFVILYLDDDSAKKEPPLENTVSYVVTLGTHDTESGAGTDSDIKLEFYEGKILASNLLFHGGRGDRDSILEKGKGDSTYLFENQPRLWADTVRVTLLQPKGNGGHWLGTKIQVRELETGKTLCGATQIGWLTSSTTNKIIALQNC